MCVCVFMYPCSAHSFGPIGMKLGMDTPCDPGSDIEVGSEREARGSEATENASAKRKARGSEATAGVGKVALRRSLRSESKG